jgi:predicted NBD/HSP70 family sugar kinase
MPVSRSAPARQRSLREHNLALVLGAVARTGPQSRARLAAATGLTKATVSSLVDTLVTGGLLQEMGPSAGGAEDRPAPGRPGLPLGLSSDGPVGIGLEINVDYIACCTVDLAQNLRRRETVIADLRDQPFGIVLDRAASALSRALSDAHGYGPVAGVSVAVPGLVDTDRGILHLAPNLGWRDLRVVEELRRRCGGHDLPIKLENEANLAALGELWCGGLLTDGGDPLRTFGYISGEIGVGAGLVMDGRLFRGQRGFGGELGHLPVSPDGPVCSCGATGCLERIAGQDAILTRAGLDCVAGPVTSSEEGRLSVLLERARAGDPRAIRAIEEAGRALGSGMAALVNVVDVDTVVLGGMYALLAPWLLEPARRELERRVVGMRWAPVRLLVSGVGQDAAVRGAAGLMIQKVVADPASYVGARSDRSAG